MTGNDEAIWEEQASWEQHALSKAGSRAASAQWLVEVSADEPPPVILDHLRRCMTCGYTLVLRVQALSQLHGFLATVVVALHTAHRHMSVCTVDSTAHFQVSADSNNGNSSTDREPTA